MLNEVVRIPRQQGAKLPVRHPVSLRQNSSDENLIVLQADADLFGVEFRLTAERLSETVVVDTRKLQCDALSWGWRGWEARVDLGDLAGNEEYLLPAGVKGVGDVGSGVAVVIFLSFNCSRVSNMDMR